MSDVKISSKLYYDAESPKKLFDKITQEESERFPGYDHLIFAKFKFLFKDKLGGEGWNKLARLSRMNDLYWSLLDIDFIIVFNKQIWEKMEIKQKITLMLHLLSKIKVYYKKSSGKRTLKKPEGEANFDITPTGRINYKIVAPDIEAFEKVSKRFSNEYDSLKELSMKSEEE